MAKWQVICFFFKKFGKPLYFTILYISPAESIDLVVKFHAVKSELEKKQYFLFYSTFPAKKTCFWVKNLVAVKKRHMNISP